jgi:hypothetical protein
MTMTDTKNFKKLPSFNESLNRLDAAAKTGEIKNLQKTANFVTYENTKSGLIGHIFKVDHAWYYSLQGFNRSIDSLTKQLAAELNPVNATVKKLNPKWTAYQNAVNEGGEGYNPHPEYI